VGSRLRRQAFAMRLASYEAHDYFRLHLAMTNGFLTAMLTKMKYFQWLR
jgi:hypothetical protein